MHPAQQYISSPAFDLPADLSPKTRWVDGQIERGFALPEGTLGLQPGGGAFLANVTYFTGRIAFRDRPVELAMLDRFAAEAAPSLGCFSYNELSIRRLEETVEVPAADGRIRVMHVNTDFVELSIPQTSSHLLIDSVVDPDEGGAPHPGSVFPAPAQGIEA